jgi:Flp pilus assembly pilin Flp
MKRVLELMCLLAVFILVIMTAIACTVPGQLPSQEVLRPILSACIILLVGYAVSGGIDAVFTKRHTTATGFG